MQSLTHPGSLATVLPAMAHIHEKIDFTVAIFVVHDGKVLLVHHRRLDKWLPLGGHIELDEDPENAALREAKIGRASCRERGWSSGGGGGVQERNSGRRGEGKCE